MSALRPVAPDARTPAGTLSRVTGAVEWLWALVRACHPEPTVAVTGGATVLAIATGRDASGVLAVAAAVLAGQLSVGWSNDWIDAARDRAVGRSDKPVVQGALSPRALAVAAVGAGIATVPLSLLSGPVAGLVHVAAVASAWLYNRPLKSTPVSVLPYLLSFGLLPSFVVLGLPGTPAPPWWLVTAGALLGGGAHFANVVGDLADDARSGIHGLPHRLGRTGSLIAAYLLLVAATAVLAFGPAGTPGWYGWLGLAIALSALATGAGYSRRPRSRAAFRVVLVVALVDVVLLLLSGPRLG